MMRPSCRSRMIGSATVTHCAAAARLPLIISNAFSGVSLSQCRSLMLIPALLRRMSRRPNSSLMKSPIRRTGRGSVRSPGWIWAVPPNSRILAATSSSGASRRPVSTIAAPSRASANAAASPMPATAARHPHDLAFELRHPSLPISGTRPYRLAGRPTRGFARLRRGDGSRLPLPAGFAQPIEQVSVVFRPKPRHTIALVHVECGRLARIHGLVQGILCFCCDRVGRVRPQTSDKPSGNPDMSGSVFQPHRPLLRIRLKNKDRR